MSKQLALFDRLLLREDSKLEFKSGRGGLPSTLWESYSAFANTDGGTIALGVAQKSDGTLEIHGLDDPEKTRQDIFNAIHGGLVARPNLLSNSSFEVLELNGKRILVVDVPRATRDQRPVYLGSDPFVGTFRRQGEGDYRCDPDEVRRMFADHSDAPGDGQVLEKFTLSDLSPESIRQYRQIFQNSQPSHQYHSLGNEEFLRRIGAVGVDRTSNKSGVTIAGLLMFGSEMALYDPRAISGYHVDYQEHLSNDQTERWTHRVTDDGNWDHNLFNFFTRVRDRLYGHLEQPYQIDEYGVRTQETDVHLALKEALVNSLIHADHFGKGGVVIHKHRDRYVFSNPGSLLVSFEQFRSGGVSECRNKTLQRMFAFLGVGDKAGSGVERIRLSWHNARWASPVVREQLNPDRVVLELPTVSTFPDQVVKRLEEVFGTEVVKNLSGDEMATLVASEQKGRIRNGDLQGMLTLHRTDITALLNGMIEKGLLERQGERRGATYAVASSPPKDPSSPPKDPSSPPKDPSSPPKDPSPPPMVPSSPHKDPNSPHKDPNSPHKDPNSPHEDPNSLHKDPNSLHKDPNSPQSDVARRTKEVSKKMVVDFCTSDFRTLQEIAVHLSREEKYVRDRILRDLINEGALQLKFPNRPTDPRQAYRKTSET
ncbi:MAG: putative DNA binding domain-containing protein [Ignavibacteria bacterium]|nr:putative DNA binding domain-containing protein [Ignavibacteria bacterium]MBK6418689.1 putative DNA binding domain-containing protein [Ignavibacteria bacterium]MBK7412763.1 putative DNA binding domain-containing protein [Ignavibacteria bacterium]